MESENEMRYIVNRKEGGKTEGKDKAKYIQIRNTKGWWRRRRRWWWGIEGELPNYLLRCKCFYEMSVPETAFLHPFSSHCG